MCKNDNLDFTKNTEKYPFVSAIIVVRNEEEYIKKSLTSLMEQDYPKDRCELILVDGLSTDKTMENINYLIKETDISKKPQDIKVLINNKKLLASGWNMAIKEAKGKYVIRIDAHAYAKENFISKSVETILSIKDAVCVGGKLTTESLTLQGETISKILSSPFGIGNSKFRYSSVAQYADTVAFGLYKKNIFEEVGYFDETLQRNQDNNMHSRIRKSGGKFYFNPEIECIYYSRDSYRKMCKQGFLNGKWNIIVLKEDVKSLSIRHLVPLFFVLGNIIGLIGAYFSLFFLWTYVSILILYFLLAIIASVLKTKKIIEIVKMVVLFFALHISYGIGSLLSIFISKN